MNAMDAAHDGLIVPEKLASSPMTHPRDLKALEGDSIAVSIEQMPEQLMRLELAATEPIPLRRIMPAVQSMDLEILHEQAGTWRGDNDSGHRYIYELLIEVGPWATTAPAESAHDLTDRIVDTFRAVWAGRADADKFNALVPAAGLTWRQVAIIRSYARYSRQLPLPYSQTRIEQAFLDSPSAAIALVRMFELRFANAAIADTDDHRTATRLAEAEVDRQIDAVPHIDADRILRLYRDLIAATVRSNALEPDALSDRSPYVVHKIAAGMVSEVPDPRPYSEIFVYSPDFEGLHLRFGAIARGGLRWSDRLDDYRTEVLGLARAQTVKNAMIVPAGAKGVFVVKGGPRTTAQADTPLHNGKRCYRHFIGALLDVVDMQPVNANHQPSAVSTTHDGPDPYLVVAADKGTATFSDLANEVAAQRGYWLGDAFASGGSSGYDHKAMGITARGAWVSGDSHLRELGIDSDADAFTVAGIGDMSGDVFGNGMLLRPNLRLVAAFDHRHIFVDPHPDVPTALAERLRLFEAHDSTWDDYDRSLIAPGGGVWSRTTKSIPVSDAMVCVLGLPTSMRACSPNELISHILRSPVDVLWNGGVGTYIKSATEQHSEVADKVNDQVRVDAEQVRARVVVEGGNLGVSAQGRIAFARAGGCINTDALDNAAGVDCSDHEVNIKTLIDSAPVHIGFDRDAVLAEMTDEVTAHVLTNNRAHNRLLSEAHANAGFMLPVHQRMIVDLENRRGLSRRLEGLPTERTFADLENIGAGLTRPELATILGHVKLDLRSSLETDPVLDDLYFRSVLVDYFPAGARHLALAADHPLARNILATCLTNELVAKSGLTYAFRLVEETGATAGDIVRAHAVVSRVFELDRLWEDVYGAGLDAATTNQLVTEGRRLLDRASRWFLLNRPQPLEVATEVARFRPSVDILRVQMSMLLGESERETVNSLRANLIETGASTATAISLSEALYAFSLLDVIEAAEQHRFDHVDVARTYFHLSEELGVDSLLYAVSRLPRAEHWHSLARLALRHDLYSALRDLTVDAVRAQESTALSLAAAVSEYVDARYPAFARVRRMLAQMPPLDNPRESPGFAAMCVAASQLRSLIEHTG